MTIDLASVKNICGDSKEVVVYGFASCKYSEIDTALCSEKYKSSQFWNFSRSFHYNICPFKLVERDHYDSLPGGRCKDIIADVILENYKRSLKNEPLIVILFCINYENKSHEAFTKNLSIEKIANSHSSEWGTITDGELRRCYKLCNEMIDGSEIKDIANKTIKFVKVINDARNYILEEIKPFWKNPNWMTLWETRKMNKSPKKMKPDPWRNALIEECKKIRAWHASQESSVKPTEQCATGSLGTAPSCGAKLN